MAVSCTISCSDAVTLVRKNLDELQANESSMFAASVDDSDFADVIRKSLAEAVNYINAKASVTMLAGDADTPTIAMDSASKVVTLTFDSEILRLIGIKASDSDITVTELTLPSSPEGRKQANKYTRGEYDHPVLVLVPGADNASFKYYSAKDAQPTFPICEFVTLKKYTGDADSYAISHELKDAILYQLTAMVLAIYGETEKAGYFTQLANNLISE